MFAHGLRGRAPALVALAVLALLVFAGSSQFTLFEPGEAGSGPGASGGYTRYESSPVSDRQRPDGGTVGWVAPAGVIAAVAVALVAGGLRFRSRRGRGEHIDEVDVDVQPEPTAVAAALTSDGAALGVQGAWRRVEDMVAPQFGTLMVSRTSASTSRLAVEAGARLELVSRLADLYDRSRYSGHPLIPAEDAEAQRLADIITGAGRDQ